MGNVNQINNTSFAAFTQSSRQARQGGDSGFVKGLMEGVSVVGAIAGKGLSLAVSKNAPGAAGLLGAGGLGGGGGGGGAGLGDTGDLNNLFNQQLELQRELQVFSMMTNIAKTEHETRMAAVRNMRP